jgi:L-ascorbate metabolism protein UlaG (beta-lactamase superfamily)
LKVSITHIDTACFLLEIGGLRILTDPVFDPPGKIYSFGFGTFSKKYSAPALSPKEIGRIDLVLLSHDQHEDNLDKSGREFIKKIPLVLSTRPAAKRIPGITGLDEWQSFEIPGTTVKVTATPAQHTGLRMLNPIAGKVIGFILEWPGQTNGVTYISGDTVYFQGIDRIAERYAKIDTAILHTGRAGFPYLTGPLHYTFHAKDALKAAEVLAPRRIIPVHCAGWWHFREKEEHAHEVYSKSKFADRIVQLSPGKPLVLGPE